MEKGCGTDAVIECEIPGSLPEAESNELRDVALWREHGNRVRNGSVGHRNSVKRVFLSVKFGFQQLRIPRRPRNFLEL